MFSGGSDTYILKEGLLFSKQFEDERCSSEGMCVKELRNEIMQHIQKAENSLALIEWRVYVREQQSREVGRARSQRTWSLYLEAVGNPLRAK